MKLVEFQAPYYHAIIDDFLSDDKLDEIKKIYQKLNFREIKSDLFRFLQTNELKSMEDLDFFRKELDRVFKTKSDLSSAYYSIFASYYKKDDFLLCHDDLIDERLYAFTFYLEDYESGELVLYEKDCTTVAKKIELVRNRLVIFKVGSTSFHEVANCNRDGRKAFTGWLNIKGLKAESPIRNRGFNIPEEVEFYDLDAVDLTQSDIFCLDFEDLETNEISRRIDGPFNDRRATLVVYDEYYIPSFGGYKLISAECLEIDEFGYILVNDRINDDLEDILDVFIFKSGDYIENFIGFVEATGEILEYIPTEYGKLIISHRKNRPIVIQRIRSTVRLSHYIYKKLNTDKQ